MGSKIDKRDFNPEIVKAVVWGYDKRVNEFLRFLKPPLF